jgi:hypothetical protein
MIQLIMGCTYLNPNSNGGTGEVKKRNNSVPLEGPQSARGGGMFAATNFRHENHELTFNT